MIKIKFKLWAPIILVSCLAHPIFAQTQINGFNDVRAGVKKDTSGYSKGFAAGQFDLFITSQVNENISYLAETVFEWGEDDWVLDVERLIIKYSVNNSLNFSAGKFHTPFGYWNNAYHHGALIQPTISRPKIVHFEDENGVLPIHQVGFQVDGSGITNKNIGYAVMVSNGQTHGNSGGTYDNTGKMAVTGNLSFEPVSDLRLTFSGYYDKVHAGTMTYQGIQLPESSNYTMLNTSLSYFNGVLPFEFVSEYYSIRNSINASSTKPTSGWFTYIGYKKFKVRPYLSYSRLNFDKDEKYFLQLGGYTAMVGVRYHPSGRSVFKLEYSQDKSASIKTNLVQFQACIGF